MAALDVGPSALSALAHPIRWEIVSNLAASDQRVGELTQLVGQPQNLVSYHLRELRDAGLVSSRRSSFDGRDTYYRVDLERCGALLCDTAAALHPALQFTPKVALPSRRSGRPPHVLFLCTGNSARSQMAAALLEHQSAGAVRARSAGSHPKPLHPNAVRVMAERGIDISANTTRHFRRYTRNRFSYVVTLCDKVREICPEFPADPSTIHWSLPDPAAGGSTDEETYPAFERAAEELETRVAQLLAQLFASSEVPRMPDDGTINVRYLVDDVEAAIDFYTRHLGFTVLNSFIPAFADVQRGKLRLLLSGPTSSAGRTMADGAKPGPGGWNRLHFIVDDLEGEITRLRSEGVHFRNEVVNGPGGAQVLLCDPSGNLVELFQPASAN